MADNAPPGPQPAAKPRGLAKIPPGLKAKARQNETVQPAPIASRPAAQVAAQVQAEPKTVGPLMPARRGLFAAIQEKKGLPAAPIPIVQPAAKPATEPALTTAPTAEPKPRIKKLLPPPPPPSEPVAEPVPVAKPSKKKLLPPPPPPADAKEEPAVDTYAGLAKSAKAEPAAAAVPVKRKKSDCLDPAGKPKPIDPEYQPYSAAVEKVLHDDTYAKYKIKAPVAPFKSSNRFFFSRFIPTKFTDFKIKGIPKADPEACKKMSFQENKYQQFIREYFRLDSPTRGALVYHGLGSGKTCSAIAAAESLFSESGRRIIVMTPVSLRANFIREIKFCGFKIYRTENHWQSLDLVDEDGKVDWSVYCFAKSVLHVSHGYMQKLIQSETAKKRIWVPDMRADKTPNYAGLKKKAQRQIAQQIDDMIQNSITFIGYNGLNEKRLKEIATNEPTFFDNATIIIDEVHNLTSLMRNRLSKYIDPAPPGKDGKPTKESVYYDPLTVEPWRLREGKERKYDRAYLIYRLLSEARNSKIIALSGTPVVNYPEELGILGNLLHGNFHSATFKIPTMDEDALKTILVNDPYVDFYRITKGVKMEVFITLLEPGFRKVIDPVDPAAASASAAAKATSTKTLPNTSVVYEGPNTPSIKEVATHVLKTIGIKDPSTVKISYSALPLFPVKSATFNDYFVDKATVRMKNSLVFMKRMSGLISFYKGGRKDYMPAINKDIIVATPMSDHMLGTYLEARAKERDAEEKTKGKADDTAFPQAPKKTISSESVGWGAITGVPDDNQVKNSVASSYRFRSRAICNYAFPRGIPRPFPRDSAEADAAASLDVATYGTEDHDQIIPIVDVPEEEAEEIREAERDDQVDIADDPTVRTLRADAEALLQRQKAADEGIMGQGLTPEMIEEMKGLSYEARVLNTIKKLRAKMGEIFSTKPTDPSEKQLAYYSPKYAAMYKNIMDLSGTGSSLVYSQFKTLEGLGIFAIALEANGYTRIRLAREGTKVSFAPETAAEIREKPIRSRYMIFSGDPEDAEFRKELVDIFNMNIEDAAYSEVKTLLTEVGIYDPARKVGNQKGEFCRIFMITGAGSEGISLKNVRAVHLMEPHWNKVRMDQVKGRAVRICSHKDLAFNQRNVDIYTYLSVMTEDQLRRNQEIVIQDKSMTSDQYIYSVAERKNRLNMDFLEAIQMGAVDCELNKIENGMYRCFHRDDTEDNFLYDPRLDMDIPYTEQYFRTLEIQRRQTILFKPEEIQNFKESYPDEVVYMDRKLKGTIGVSYTLLYTEMISPTGKPYYGLFSDQELTHPVPFDRDREFGRVEIDPETKAITDIEFKPRKEEPVAPVVADVAAVAAVPNPVAVAVPNHNAAAPNAAAPNPEPTDPQEEPIAGADEIDA